MAFADEEKSCKIRGPWKFPPARPIVSILSFPAKPWMAYPAFGAEGQLQIPPQRSSPGRRYQLPWGATAIQPLQRSDGSSQVLLCVKIPPQSSNSLRTLPSS